MYVYVLTVHKIHGLFTCLIIPSILVRLLAGYGYILRPCRVFFLFIFLIFLFCLFCTSPCKSRSIDWLLTHESWSLVNLSWSIRKILDAEFLISGGFRRKGRELQCACPCVCVYGSLSLCAWVVCLFAQNSNTIWAMNRPPVFLRGFVFYFLLCVTLVASRSLPTR